MLHTYYQTCLGWVFAPNRPNIYFIASELLRMKSAAKYDTNDKPPREEVQVVTEQCNLKSLSKQLLMHGADDRKQMTSLTESERNETNEQLRNQADRLRQKVTQMNASCINFIPVKDQDRVVMFYFKNYQYSCI